MNLNNNPDCRGRLLQFLYDFQRKYRARPKSNRLIARETGISHTHVGTLIKEMISNRTLKVHKRGYAFERIPIDVSFWGMRWLPLVECRWTRPIDWTDYEDTEAGEGDWIPIVLFALPPRKRVALVLFLKDEPDTESFPPIVGIDCMAIVCPLKHPSDAKIDEWCLVTHRNRVRSMYRAAGGKFIHFRGLTKSPLEIPVEEVSHVAVIHTMMETRTREQNRRHWGIAKMASMAIKSSDFKNQECDEPVISLRLDTLRKKRRVPHQLRLPGVGDTERVEATIAPTTRRNRA
jgi:hypothetical protein